MSVIDGSIVLITGAASGIGRRLALLLAKRASHVVLWDIQQDKLQESAELVRAEHGAEPHPYVCDLTDRAAIYSVADKVKQEVGEVDILVNNAGIVSGKPFLELSDEAILRTFQVNTLALFWTCKAFLPGMIQRNRGHVVTLASSAGLIGVRGLADYCGSKFAAVGFDESLRMELRKTAPKVHTTVVMPFFIDTGMFEGARSRFPLLLPILRESDVAARIARAIARREPRLSMPPIVRLVPPLRALPVRAFDTIADLLGINASMDHFVGRTGSPQR